MTALADMGIALGFAGLGALTGLAHFKLLSWNVRALTGQSHGLAALGAVPGRALLALVAFLFAALHGALALIAALAGFLLCRSLFTRRPEILLP